MTANCTRCCGRHSTVAPRIEQHRGPAARRDDRRQRRPIDAGQPAERRVRRHHRRAGMAGAEERVGAAVAHGFRRHPDRRRGLRRSAAAAGSAISMRSGASAISMSSQAAPGCRDSSRSMAPRAPTSSRPTCRCRAATSAPSMMLAGAWSPPIASMAIRTVSCQLSAISDQRSAGHAVPGWTRSDS